jgi:hypothetical protein
MRDEIQEAMNAQKEQEEPKEPLQVEDSKPEPEPASQQAPEEGESEEVKPFADKGELKGKTPEELDEIYKDWTKKYTQTRQREREELRTVQQKVQELQTQLEQAQKVSRRDIDSPDLKQAAHQAQNQLDVGNMTVQEYTTYIARLASEEARRAAQETFVNERQQQEDQSYQDQAVAEMFADSRLNPDSPEYDQKMFAFVVSNMEVELDRYLQEHGTSVGFDYKNALNGLKEDYDGYITSLVSQRVRSTTDIARQKARTINATTVSGRDVKTGNAPPNLRDAIAQSMRG